VSFLSQEGAAWGYAKDEGEDSIACILFLFFLLRPLIFLIVIVGELPLMYPTMTIVDDLLFARRRTAYMSEAEKYT